jgi:CheY-like chemotaxis protein
MNQPAILIVDDDESNRGVLCDALGGEPYKLLEAANGQQALDIADKEQPDLILLDVLMPGMDGIATLQKLKADTANADPLGPWLTIDLFTNNSRLTRRPLYRWWQECEPSCAGGSGGENSRREGRANHDPDPRESESFR